MTDSVNQPVEQRILLALQAHVFDNHGLLQPGQLQTIATELAELARDSELAPRQLGQRLNQQGLALISLLDAGQTLLDGVQEQGQQIMIQAIRRRLHQVIVGFHESELRRLRDEQQRIQEAVRRVAQEREQEASNLRDLVFELSTPVVPVYQGILIVPLVGPIDSRRSNEIMERLLDSVMAHAASSVIIDITGVPVVDTGVAQHLLSTAQATNLLGSEVVLVGINPEIAQTIVQLGINLGSIVTQSNLEQGLAYALHRRGLGIYQQVH